MLRFKNLGNYEEAEEEKPNLLVTITGLAIIGTCSIILLNNKLRKLLLKWLWQLQIDE